MEKWFIAAKRADFQRIADTFGITPVTARLIRNRDIVGEEAIREYLYGTTADLHDPHLMKDMDRAADIICEKIAQSKRIRIVGDYDIDGVCATYILFKGLKQLGACCDFYIPDRMKDGYGINAAIIERAREDGIDTIVTCDNGISAIGEIASAREAGMTVIVTDHHDIPYEEGPDGERCYKKSAANAVVNPKQADCAYPFKLLCGAAVAYRLVQVLYEKSGMPDAFREAEKEFLPFAAIATVGDIMDLKGENRILVKQGLKALADTENPGLRALMDVCGVNPGQITAYQIGFVIGPCINASGRLDTARRSLKLLLCEDDVSARRLAMDLKELNDERKDMTAKGTEEAIRLIGEMELLKDSVLVVPLYGCHESLAGIIAGRIREKYNRPVFVLTRGEAGIKGSGRSIEGYSMYEELTKCSRYLEKFGGHPMAAGLSMRESQVEAFRKSLNAGSSLTEEDFIPKVTIDVAMPLEYISERQIRELSLLEPFGKGNEKPMFAQKDLRVLHARILGKNRNVLKLLVESPAGGVQMEALYFGDIPCFDAYIRERFGADETEKMYLGRKNAVTLSVVYYPDVNEYRGVKTMQIVIKNYQ